VGVEEANRYRGGTLVGKRAEFHKKEVLLTTVPNEIVQGSLIIDISRDLMPTFASKHNRVLWLIRAVAQGGPLQSVEVEANVKIMPLRRH